MKKHLKLKRFNFPGIKTMDVKLITSKITPFLDLSYWLKNLHTAFLNQPIKFQVSNIFETINEGLCLIIFGYPYNLQSNVPSLPVISKQLTNNWKKVHGFLKSLLLVLLTFKRIKLCYHNEKKEFHSPLNWYRIYYTWIYWHGKIYRQFRLLIWTSFNPGGREE